MKVLLLCMYYLFLAVNLVGLIFALYSFFSLNMFTTSVVLSILFGFSFIAVAATRRDFTEI